MKRKTAPEYVLLTGLCLATGSVLYRNQGAGSDPTPVRAATVQPAVVSQAPTNRPVAVAVTTPLTPRDREVIRDYVNSHADAKGRTLAPGLSRTVERNKMPAGWESKLVKGEIMSPEIYRQCHALPGEVVRRLPPQPHGTELVSIDGKIIRLARINLQILDVFDLRS